jgi:hypothetical protein
MAVDVAIAQYEPLDLSSAKTPPADLNRFNELPNLRASLGARGGVGGWSNRGGDSGESGNGKTDSDELSANVEHFALLVRAVFVVINRS